MANYRHDWWPDDRRAAHMQDYQCVRCGRRRKIRAAGVCPASRALKWSLGVQTADGVIHTPRGVIELPVGVEKWSATPLWVSVWGRQYDLPDLEQPLYRDAEGRYWRMERLDTSSAPRFWAG